MILPAPAWERVVPETPPREMQAEIDLRMDPIFQYDIRRLRSNEAQPNRQFKDDFAMWHYLSTVVLLCCSNVFMTFAWYGHLKNLNDRPWIIAALVSWGIALFEYLLQVPANRIGHQAMSVGQLKVLQEVITLSVFVPFSYLYLREKLSLDYLWAGCCLLGAAYFIFRQHWIAT